MGFFLMSSNQIISNKLYLLMDIMISYLPPSYEKLRTTLLKEMKNDLIKDLDVVKERWKEIVSTITCDV
jgi:hypothetical protein